MASLYKDDAYTTLAASLSAGALTCTVTSNATFPTISGGNDFFVTLRKASNGAKETIKVTANATTAWTIVRAQGEGEAALAFDIGDSVNLRIGKNVMAGLTIQPFETKTRFTAALSGLANGRYLVLADESITGSPRTEYSVASGVATLSRVTHRFAVNELYSILDFIDNSVVPHGSIRDGTNAADLSSYIATALTAATGKRLHAPGGTYKCNNLAVPSNIEISGDGKSTIFELNAAGDVFTLAGRSNVVIRDLKIDGKRATYTANTNDGIAVLWTSTAGSDIRIENVNLSEIAGAGIIALAAVGTPSNGLIIDGCRILNCGAHGVIVQDYISKVRITNNRVENTGLTTSDRPGITAARNGSDVIIANNEVYGSDSAIGTSVHGISMDIVDNFACFGNVIDNWIGFGIEVAFCTNGAITGNVIKNTDRAGIGCSGNEASSVFCQNIAILGNTITGGASQGIYSFVTGGTGVILHKDIDVCGNVINGSAAQSGIELDFVDGVAVNSNIVKNTFLSGIWLLDCREQFISGNKVTACNAASIKSVTSLTQAAGTATATSVAHGYSTSDVITVFGAVPSEYNGAFTITVTGVDTFTYSVSSSIAATAAGSIGCTKYNNGSHGGIKIQRSALAIGQTPTFGMNFVERNGFRDYYDISVNGIEGFFNHGLYFKEGYNPRAENLTSGVNANERDRTALFMRNNQLNIAYNNSGTQRSVKIDLDPNSDTSIPLMRAEGAMFVNQSTPTAKTVSATLTAEELLPSIITVLQGAGATSALQLPTAGDLDTALSHFVAGDAFDFSLINLSTVAAEDASITTNTGWTLIGNMDVASNAAATDKSAGRFQARKTGTAAWTLYRLS